jgi:flagellar FliJ protein
VKKFKFRLERVLHYRVLIKEEKRKVLLQKNYQLQKAQERLESLLAAERANVLAVGTMTAARVQLTGDYSSWLEQAVTNQRLAIIRAQEEVDAAMAEYIEATKEARSLEMLKDRKRTEHQEMVDHEDAKFLDELSTQKGNHFQIEG